MQEWQKPETVTLWIIIIVAFLLLLLTFITLLIRTIFKKIVRTKINEANAQLEYQKLLLESTIKTQEKERKRVAEDIHDALIGKLTVLQMESQIKHPNADSVNLISECISTARRISHDLSPPLLEYTPLSELIEDILHPWEKVITIIYTNDIRNDFSHSNDLKIHLTRIIQEMITNITKHANATKIIVHIRQAQNGLALRIEDNGKGFSMTNNQKGLGLKNIETRVQYLQGIYKMKSKLNKGTSALFLFKLLTKNE